MIRLFNVYYPVRTLVLLAGEALVVWTSFVLGTMLRNQDSWLLLNVDGGYLLAFDRSLRGSQLKILAVTAVVLLLSHWFDLYDSSHLGAKWEETFRLLLVLGLLGMTLSALGFIFPNLLPGNDAALVGLIILIFTLFCWRGIYSWMVKQPFLRERIYVLGTGERAERLVKGLRQRAELGIEVVGWTGTMQGALTLDSVASHLAERVLYDHPHRVIVAMPDRRGTIPVRELLQLRLDGVKIEEATSWLEKISGRIEVEQLYPSWLIFAEGFRFSASLMLLRRLFSTLASALLLIGSVAGHSVCDSGHQTGLARFGAVPAETRRAGWENFLLSTSSAPCGRTPRRIPAQPGPWTTIRELPAWEGFCGFRGSMRFLSCGACSEVTWDLSDRGRNALNSWSG